MWVFMSKIMGLQIVTNDLQLPQINDPPPPPHTHISFFDCHHSVAFTTYQPMIEPPQTRDVQPMLA